MIWQTIVVALTVLVACFYVGRRAWMRLRSFFDSRGSVEPLLRDVRRLRR